MKYTIKLGSCIDGTVPLGWQNENKVKEVYFDASKWVAEYGAGILTLAIQRNGDAQPYPKALTDDTWTIEAVDVEKKGIGEFQVTFTVGEQVKESAVYKFFVERSLDSTGEMPDPYISYFEQIIEVGAKAEADADRAEEAADKAEQAASNAGYMFFHIDEAGHLIYERTPNTQVDFYLSNGHLFVEAIA